MKKLLTVAALLLPLVATAQYEPAPQPPPSPGYAPAYAPAPAPYSRRSPWYVGFGFGGGSGNVSAWGTTDTLDKLNKSIWVSAPAATDLTYNFKIGMTLSERLLAGFDITGIASLLSGSGQSSSVTVTNYDAVATFFPMGEGLFVRGGVGVSRLTGSWDDGTSKDSESISGLNALVGAGYAFWVGQRFNLTLNVDYSVQTYGAADFPATLAGAFPKPEKSDFLALWVGFDWY